MPEQRPIPKDPLAAAPPAALSLGGGGEMFSLSLVLSGTGKLRTEDGAAPVASGALCLWRTDFPPEREGAWSAAEVRFGAVLLSEEVAAALGEVAGAAVSFPEPWAIELAHALIRAAGAAGARLAPKLAETLVLLVLENRRAPGSYDGADLRVRRVAAYVREHYRKKLSVSMIADTFDISPNYLGKCFRAEMQISLPEYIKRVRLDEAMRLITETNYTLERIAYETGFKAYACFFREFKKQFGKTPLCYRKQRA